MTDEAREPNECYGCGSVYGARNDVPIEARTVQLCNGCFDGELVGDATLVCAECDWETPEKKSGYLHPATDPLEVMFSPFGGFECGNCGETEEFQFKDYEDRD